MLDSGTDAGSNKPCLRRAPALTSRVQSKIATRGPGFPVSLGSLPRSLPGPSLPSLEAVPSGFDPLSGSLSGSGASIRVPPFLPRGGFPSPSWLGVSGFLPGSPKGPGSMGFPSRIPSILSRLRSVPGSFRSSGRHLIEFCFSVAILAQVCFGAAWQFRANLAVWCLSPCRCCLIGRR